MWRTLAVILVVLTVFGGALLAISSVALDMRSGMIAGIDASKKRYVQLYGGECFALRASACGAEAAVEYGAELCYGEIEGVTFGENAVLSLGEASFAADTVTQLGGSGRKLEYRVERHGYFLPKQYADGAFFSSQPRQTGIWLCGEAASQLNASKGDVVSLGGKQYTVLGEYDRKDVAEYDYNADESVLPSAWYYVVDDADGVVFDELYLTWHTAQTFFEAWDISDRTLGISDIMNKWWEDMALVQSYYGSLALLLLALDIFLLYVLFTLFFRERKGHICRIKLLGATDITVTGVYLTIALAVVVLSALAASGLSVLIGKHMMRVCSDLFGVTYPYRFRVWQPLSLLGLSVVAATVMFALFYKRISRLPVAEEVRYE